MEAMAAPRCQDADDIGSKQLEFAGFTSVIFDKMHCGESLIFNMRETVKLEWTMIGGTSTSIALGRRPNNSSASLLKAWPLPRSPSLQLHSLINATNDMASLYFTPVPFKKTVQTLPTHFKNALKRNERTHTQIRTLKIYTPLCCSHPHSPTLHP